MKLLPSETFAIDVPRPPAEVADVIERQTGEPIRFAVRWPKDHEPFYGAVGPAGFRLRPVAGGWGGNPVVHGWFEPRGETTRVHVRIRQSALRLIPFLINPPIIWYYSLVGLQNGFSERLSELSAALIALALPLVFVAIVLYSVHRNNRYARRLMERVLEGAGVSPHGSATPKGAANPQAN